MHRIRKRAMARPIPALVTGLIVLGAGTVAVAAEPGAEAPPTAESAAPPATVGARFVNIMNEVPAVPPALVLTCSPIGGLADLFGQVVALNPALGEAAERLTPDNPLLPLLYREGMLDAGLNPEGAFSLAMRETDDKKTLTLSIPFSGNELKAHAFLAAKVTSESQLEAEIGGWRIREKKGETFARLKEGALTIETTEVLLSQSRDSKPEPGVQPLLPALIQDLPGGEGCVMYADFEKISTQTEPQPRMLFFAPLGSSPLYSLRAHLPPELTTVSLGSPQASPVLGKSIAPPLLLMSINSPLLDLLRQPGLPPNLVPPPELLKALDQKVRVLGGSSLAIFGDMNLLIKRDFSAAGVIAVIPLRQASGLPATGRGLRRTLEKTLKQSDKGTVERLSPRRLKVVSTDEQKSTLYIESRCNRLWIASSEPLLEDALGKKGNSWGGERYLAASHRWPVQLQMTLPQPDQKRIEFTSGIELTQQNLRIDVDTGPGQVGNTLMMAALSAIAIPNFQTMQLKSKRAELMLTVSTIAAAEEMYVAEQGEALVLSAAPRSMADLNTTAVQWMTPPEWLPLDLQLNGTYRGIYWVEVTADRVGYTVHGMADLDGDGMVSHVKQERGQSAVLITPQDIY